MVFALPKLILLKQNGNNKYLHYLPSNKEKGLNNSFLHFSDNVKDQKETDQSSESETGIPWNRLRFEVEKAKTVEGFVHIRTCYNNKYWVRKSEDSNEIVAEADEGEEDVSKWNSTLFKPVFVNGDDTKMRLLHLGGLKQGGYVGTNNSKSLSLSLSLSDEEDAGVFTVINVESTAILPEYVTFMGYNDKYVTADYDMLILKASDVGENTVAHRIVYDSETHDMYILNRDRNDYWYGGDVISPVVLNDTIRTVFVPIKVGEQIALCCPDPIVDLFVNTVNTGDGVIVLYTRSKTIGADSILRVGEPVRSREILEASYDLDNARIYNRGSIELFTDSRTNKTSVEQQGSFDVSYKNTKAMTWKQSSTVSIGIKVTCTIGIPLIDEMGVEISADASVTWEYGVEQTDERDVGYTQGVNIAPGKKVTLKVVASKAYCDVPFVCKVRDLMTDGTTREYTKTDGLFVGCNAFDFQTEITEDDA